MIQLVEDDIVFANCDIIVNAANGCGYMGGKRCAKNVHKGTAERLNFVTNGRIESLSKKEARKHIISRSPGTIFVTDGCGLDCKKVIHAVTMRYPGSRSKYETIERLMIEICEYCYDYGLFPKYKTIAMTILGTGVGGLDKQEVFKIIENSLKYFKKLELFIYTLPASEERLIIRKKEIKQRQNDIEIFNSK